MASRAPRRASKEPGRGTKASAKAGTKASAKVGAEASAHRVAELNGPGGLTHFDAAGAARMVEVGDKPESARVGVASGKITMQPATAAAISAGRIGKGDVLAVARLAGIGGAKRTSEWIPLCHPLRLTGVEVAFELGPQQVAITATVRAFDRSGVEMEALAAVAAAALTIYDMCKAIDRGMVISEIRLEEKLGGKSGRWRRADP
ncbi:MAG: cyclic pyranopterin monophosphate synthase MoaC [Myxococcales bacterium]|nr:cyclic pyranopterin monophosphate synthase MoaC [Myxococcales bacterium]